MLSYWDHVGTGDLEYFNTEFYGGVQVNMVRADTGSDTEFQFLCLQCNIIIGPLCFYLWKYKLTFKKISLERYAGWKGVVMTISAYWYLINMTEIQKWKEDIYINYLFLEYTVRTFFVAADDKFVTLSGEPISNSKLSEKVS